MEENVRLEGMLLKTALEDPSYLLSLQGMRGSMLHSGT